MFIPVGASQGQSDQKFSCLSCEPFPMICSALQYKNMLAITTMKIPYVDFCILVLMNRYSSSEVCMHCINLFSGAKSAISKGVLFSFYNLLFRTGHYFLGAWRWGENFSFQEYENPGLVALILSRKCEIPPCN